MKFTLSVLLLPLLALSGCSLLYSNIDPQKSQAQASTQADRWQVSGEDSVVSAPTGSGLSYRPDRRDLMTQRPQPVAHQYQDPLPSGFRASLTHKPLHDYADQLAMQLMAHTPSLDDANIGVASFVRLNQSLQETTVLGNQLSEYLMAVLQDYGVSVVEYKLAPSLFVTPHGDIALTRDSRLLKTTAAIDHVLTGTMVETPRGVQINARIVTLKTGQLVAASSLQIPAFMVTSLNHPQAESR
ncbi:hypothetical protein IT774_05885 [Salinimonas marina]|uniref:FlgO domain-containing protein n=1 Tax=Salinimonas marina TaxID=2785918 RepID=A0A7S9HDZ8_9ALTE|nr:FlgO family outer membrane protein [Salinimonas marina]QPG06679.1 hypothetical protein IT774_05885 [Salinimonas marina]